MMTAKKRTSTVSPASSSTPSKKWQNKHRKANAMSAPGPTSLSNAQTMDRTTRPTSTRISKQAKSKSKMQKKKEQTAAQPINVFRRGRGRDARFSSRPQNRQDVQLRFSFSNAATPERNGLTPLKAHRVPSKCKAPIDPSGSPLVRKPSSTRPRGARPTDATLTSSFNGLIVTGDRDDAGMHTRHAPVKASQEPSPTTSKLRNTPDPSVFTKPSKNREGYGFSYSESLWCDSDEYPDTECDWDASDTQAEDTEPDSGARIFIEQNSSFDDMVVMRDVGSFHIAKPQKALPCTQATREDTIRLKQQAKSLFKWRESGDMYAQLTSRLEKMIYGEMEKAKHRLEGSKGSGESVGSSKGYQMPSMTDCAIRLRDFLVRIKDERVETGESRRFVEHEIEWVKWLVEASRVGVMHLKTVGCRCRPDWEED